MDLALHRGFGFVLGQSEGNQRVENEASVKSGLRHRVDFLQVADYDPVITGTVLDTAGVYFSERLSRVGVLTASRLDLVPPVLARQGVVNHQGLTKEEDMELTSRDAIGLGVWLVVMSLSPVRVA